MEVDHKNPGALYPKAHQASWTWLMAVGDLVSQLIGKGYIGLSCSLWPHLCLGTKLFLLKVPSFWPVPDDSHGQELWFSAVGDSGITILVPWRMIFSDVTVSSSLTDLYNLTMSLSH